MKTSIYYLAIAILGILTLNSCSDSAADMPTTTENEVERGLISISSTQFQKSGYELGKLEKRNFQNYLPVNGSIHLPEKNRAAVSSFVGGKVSSIDLIHGQWVKRGQRLFSLSNPELISWQQEYMVLSSELDYQKVEYDRQKQLSDENITAKKNLNKAEVNLKVTTAKLAGLSKKLSMIVIKPSSVSPENLISSLPIYAPTSGYISDIHLNQGMFLEPFETALEISNTNHLHMELKVLEKDISKIKNGQSIRYTLQDNPEQKFVATIYLIERLVDENRMINIHCHLEEEQEKSLFPGMFVAAEIALSESESLAIPEDAVVVFDHKYFVLEQEGIGEYDFTQKGIEVGLLQDGYYQLLDSKELNSEANFLTKGAYYLILGE